MATLGSTDISIMAVHNILGDPSLDLGTLCISDNVNMWSKYKPVVYAADSTASNANWYKGIDGQCGLAISWFGSDFSTIDSSTWTRFKPFGTAQSPYRLGDFRNYNHNAVPVLSTNKTEDVVVNRGTDSYWYFYPNIYSGTDTTNLKYSDIYLGSKYLGDYYVALQVTDGSYSIFACATNTIANKGYIKLDLSAIPSSWIGNRQTLRFFICGDSFSQKTSWTVQDYQYCMWQNSNNKTTLGITVKEDAMFNIRINGLNTAVQSSAANYVAYSNYITTDTARELNVNGYVYYLCTFTNRSSGSFQIPLSSIRGRSTNWWSGSISRTVPVVYTTSGTQVSSAITLTANSTSQYVLGWNYNYKNNVLTSSPDSVTIKANVAFDYLLNGTYIDVDSPVAAFYVRSAAL